MKSQTQPIAAVTRQLVRLVRLAGRAALTLILVVMVVAEVNQPPYFGAAPISFAVPVAYPTGQGPFSITTLDFNGDGVLDLVVPNRDSANLTLFRGVGDGTFAPLPAPLAGGSCPIFAVAGDFNRDGAADLAVINHLCHTLFILPGMGDGTFAAPNIYQTAEEPRGIAVGDFNRDGADDLAIANRLGGTISIFIGRGDGAFRPRVDYPAGLSPHAVVAADFNGDQLPDLAVANTGTNSVTIFQNTGMGGFRSLPDIPAGLGSTALVATDLNRDGRPDLVVADGGQGGVSVLLGDGPFSFASLRFYPTGSSPLEVRSADFNADSYPDVVVVNRNSDNVTVLLGTGDGAFARTTHLNNFATGRTPFDVVTGDFNRDGRIDLATANFVDNTLAILLADEPRFADLGVTVEPSPPMATGVLAGTEVTWVVRVSNNGPDPAVNVEVRNSSPEGMTPLSCVVADGLPCVIDGNQQRVVVPQLAPGATVTISIAERANENVCDGTRLVDTARVTAQTPDPFLENNTAESLVLGRNTPPTIAPLPDLDVINQRPGERSGVAVALPLPVAADNTGGLTVVCQPASGSLFPVGNTRVTCTATDICGLTAMTSFNVRVWDILLVDDYAGHVLLFDSFTGVYLFRRADTGQEYQGRGQITRQGCEIRLSDDKRAEMTYNRCLRRAAGLFRPTGAAPVFRITDRYTASNRL